MAEFNYPKITIQSYSTMGVRTQNEDAMDIMNNLDHKNENYNDILYVGVFDGHGGPNVSKLLAEKDKTSIDIGKYFYLPNSQIAATMSASERYNKKLIEPLFARIQEKLKNFHLPSNKMGSTVLITLIYPKNEKKDKYNIKVINLGDSRATVCNEYNIGVKYTLDHKPHLFCEKGRLMQSGGTLEQSEGDDPRINGMSVSRSFGDLDNRFISQVPDVFDYVFATEKFMIMACDGVWDVLSDQDAVDFVLEKMGEIKKNGKHLVEFKGKSEQNIACKLADYAIAKGSTDNISIVILFFTDNLK